MGDNKRKYLMIFVIIVIVILIIVLIKNKENGNIAVSNTVKENANMIEDTYTVSLEDGKNINVSEDFHSTKTYKDLQISNIQFIEENGTSTLLADIMNKGNTTHEAEIVKIMILGENGNVIAEIETVFGKVESGETIQLNARITSDITNAKDFRIEEK